MASVGGVEGDDLARAVAMLGWAATSSPKTATGGAGYGRHTPVAGSRAAASARAEPSISGVGRCHATGLRVTGRPRARGGRIGIGAGEPPGVAPDDVLVPQVAARQVQDDAAEVGGRLVDVAPHRPQADERLLHQVLGNGVGAGDDMGQPGELDPPLREQGQ